MSSLPPPPFPQQPQRVGEQQDVLVARVVLSGSWQERLGVRG